MILQTGHVRQYRLLGPVTKGRFCTSVLKGDPESTMIFTDTSFEEENFWAMETPKHSTLKDERNGYLDEHGNFILGILRDTCPLHMPPESGTVSATTTYETCNPLGQLVPMTFRRIVVDAYVYHKYCKSRWH